MKSAFFDSQNLNPICICTRVFEVRGTQFIATRTRSRESHFLNDLLKILNAEPSPMHNRTIMYRRSSIQIHESPLVPIEFSPLSAEHGSASSLLFLLLFINRHFAPSFQFALALTRHHRDDAFDAPQETNTCSPRNRIIIIAFIIINTV